LAAADHGTLGAALSLETAGLVVELEAIGDAKAGGNATSLVAVGVSAGGAGLLETVWPARGERIDTGDVVAAGRGELHAAGGRASR